MCMIFRILNSVTKAKVDKIRPKGVRFLNNDLKQQEDLLEEIKGGKDTITHFVHCSDTTWAEKNIDMIKGRINVDKKYIALLAYFASDQKRLYIINRNYLNFLKAIIFLYSTSQSSASIGILTAPAKVYQTINAVQESFKDATNSLSLN